MTTKKLVWRTDDPKLLCAQIAGNWDDTESFAFSEAPRLTKRTDSRTFRE